VSDGTVQGVVAALRGAHPELEKIAAATADPVYLVGGAVRDQLLDRGRGDIDVVVIGDAGGLARALGAPSAEHERFATAKVELGGHQVDVATARTETYPEPGALPVVEPATTIEEDLGRRDFTINAMAVPLRGEPGLIDPYGGREDVKRCLLRVLHERSFVDDPTRAIRAARYAARFGFALEAATEALLCAADLETVSQDRRVAELRRLAGEESAARGFELLRGWGLLDVEAANIELVAAVSALLRRSPWREEVEADEAVLAAATEAWNDAPDDWSAWVRALVELEEPIPSQGVELARGHDSVQLAVARAMGADWLDRYLADWRNVALEIDGEDLLRAGVPQGPALGRGLDAALRAKLDGEASGREQELAVALEAARAT
jgi:tRNA nucleotidyltransferase (CCA-adding enzyme)